MTTTASFKHSMEQLIRWHSALIENLATPLKCSEGEFTIAGDRLTGTCLRRPFTVEWRPVLATPKLWALEYRFLTEDRDKKIELLRFYVDEVGAIYPTTQLVNSWGDVDQDHLKIRLMRMLAEALLASDVFKPTPPHVPEVGIV